MPVKTLLEAITDKCQQDHSYCLYIVEQHQLMVKQMFDWQRSRNPLKRYFAHKWQDELIRRTLTS